MESILVCRRIEDYPDYEFEKAVCSRCKKDVYVEGGANQREEKICIHCAVKTHTAISLFVELPPDEFGGRSIAVDIREVYAKNNGEWHKTGIWHNAKLVLGWQ